jgi:hypothetical protein
MEKSSIEKLPPMTLQEVMFERHLRNTTALLKESPEISKVEQALNHIWQQLEENFDLLSSQNIGELKEILVKIHSSYPNLLSGHAQETMNKVNDLWLKLSQQLFCRIC